jgi:hypothetical protein
MQTAAVTTAAVASKRATPCHALHAPTKIPGFPRVNSAPVTPMAADCIDMTDMSSLCAVDDVNEPLIRAADRDGAITFV